MFTPWTRNWKFPTIISFTSYDSLLPYDMKCELKNNDIQSFSKRTARQFFSKRSLSYNRNDRNLKLNYTTRLTVTIFYSFSKCSKLFTLQFRLQITVFQYHKTLCSLRNLASNFSGKSLEIILSYPHNSIKPFRFHPVEVHIQGCYPEYIRLHASFMTV